MREFEESKIDSMMDGKIPVVAAKQNRPIDKLSYKEIQRYDEINKEINKLEKEKKILNTKFKEVLGKDKQEYQVNDYIVRIIPQDKSKLDEVKAISYIKTKAADKVDELVEAGMELEAAEAAVEQMFRGVIYTIEKLDETILENLFFNGILVAKEFQEACVIPDSVTTLRIDKYDPRSEEANKK
jgi:hypothetical protein